MPVESSGWYPVSTTILRFLVNRIARAVFAQSAEQAVEDFTGVDVPFPGEVLQDVAQDVLGREPANQQEAREVVQMAVDRGHVTTRDLRNIEQQAMVDFNQFMSIGLEQCGSDKETFSDLVDVWNREKDDIRNMTVAQVRQNLRCP